MGVNRHSQAQHVGLIHQRLHFFQAVLLAADGVGFRQHAAGAAELDDFRTILAQFTYCGPNFIRAIGHRGRGHCHRGWELG